MIFFVDIAKRLGYTVLMMKQAETSQSKNSRHEYNLAVLMGADQWVPANGGLERPVLYPDGVERLYVVNPARAQGRVSGFSHGWLNLGTDIVSEEDPNG